MVAERVPQRARPGRPRSIDTPRCVNGHKRTFHNLYRDSFGRIRCRPCIRATWRRYRQAHPSTPKGRRPRGQTLVCRQGHPRTPESTFVRRNGDISCRVCINSAARAAYARKKAQTSPTTALTSIAPHSPAERPLGTFDAVVAAQVAQAREIRARGEVRFSDAVNAGLAAARERRRAALGSLAGKPTPEQIRQATADAFGLDVADLTGPSREYDVSHPRQAAYYLIRQECPDVTFEAIGALFGGRDHTTTIYGYQKIEGLVAAGDEDTLRLLDVIREASA